MRLSDGLQSLTFRVHTASVCRSVDAPVCDCQCSEARPGEPTISRACWPLRQPASEALRLSESVSGP